MLSIFQFQSKLILINLFYLHLKFIIIKITQMQQLYLFHQINLRARKFANYYFLLNVKTNLAAIIIKILLLIFQKHIYRIILIIILIQDCKPGNGVLKLIIFFLFKKFFFFL